MTPIIVALIGAAATITAAFFGRKREETRASTDDTATSRPMGPSSGTPTPRPALVFACILALGIAVTAVVVGLLPRDIETTFEPRRPNVEYQERETGFVFAVAKATGKNRRVAIDGFIGAESVASTAAQDATVPGVPSITSTSFVMPVSKGQK